MRVWVGTAGYSYPEWVGPVYPAGTPANRLLAAYCRHFPLVEVNNTYYRCPTPEQFENMLGQTPAGFRFTVKLPKTVSHDQLPDELPSFRRAAAVLAGRGRLLGVLAQFPETFRDAPHNRGWVEEVADALGGLRLAVEFRHRTWADAGVPGWLASVGADLVSVDVPDLPQLFPRGLVRSGDRLYLRLHSRTPANWYNAAKARYDYDYPDDVLGEWIDTLRRAAPDCREALVLFNNCTGTQAVDNARRFREMAARHRELDVVDPFAPPAPRQLTLFD